MKEQFSIRLESDDKKKITIIAKRNKRTLNSQLEYIISNAIADYEKVNGKISDEETI
jgi:predicted transcriptional regulator